MIGSFKNHDAWPYFFSICKTPKIIQNKIHKSGFSDSVITDNGKAVQCMVPYGSAPEGFQIIGIFLYRQTIPGLDIGYFIGSA